jgi:predicted ATPase/DNA-binding winged helix-turn-helix (wHTH) protein
MRGGYRFGAFYLDLRGDLHHDGVPVTAGGKALRLLARLLEAGGGVVSREELIDAAWPGMVVEEGNLSVQIAALRQILGDAERPHRLIVTVPRRGYRFGGAIDGAKRPAAPSGLPGSQAVLIGRDSELALLQAAMTRHRLVTLVGSGGLGKTRLAREFARGHEEAGHVTRFAALEMVHVRGQVAARLAAACGVDPAGRDPVMAVAAWLRQGPVLLVIDNCEHVLDEVRGVAAVILEQAPGAMLLATSRVALGAAGEHVIRLKPLGFPRGDEAVTAETALDYPAVRLFAVRAAPYEFLIGPETAALAGEICRRLDGIPLAIELAAPRLARMSAAALRDGLADRLPGEAGGRQDGPVRQRTLEATLSWSFGLLSEAEQALLRRLGVFAGSFSFDAICAVAAAPPIKWQDVAALLGRLIEASMVVRDAPRGNVSRYRLFETTRAFALGQMEAEEARDCRYRLLNHLIGFYAQSEDDYRGMATAPWLPVYAADWDNAQAALDWAFGPGGDTLAGQRLVCCSGPVLAELQLRRVSDAYKAAFARIDAGTPPEVTARLRCLEVKLLGVASAEMAAKAREAVGIFRALDDGLRLGEALMRLGKSLIRPGETSEALAFLEEAETYLRRFGHQRWLATCLGLQSYACAVAGDFVRAKGVAEAGLKVAQAVGCQRSILESRAWLADLARDLGDAPAAMAEARVVMVESRKAGQMAMAFYAAMRLTGLLIGADDLAGARAALAEALACYSGEAASLRLLLSQAAVLAARLGEWGTAARLLGFLGKAVMPEGSFPDAGALAAREAAEAGARAALAEDEYRRHLAAGAAWYEDGAIRAAGALAVLVE